MHRTQILLEPWQHEALRSLAERQGISLSAVLRAILTEHLDARREPVGDDALADLAGLVNEPGTSGAEHDAALHGPVRRRATRGERGKPTGARSGKGRRAGGGRKAGR
jgi:hypothetical protein